MTTTTDIARRAAHDRQVAYVRASLLRGVTYGSKSARGGDRIVRAT